MWLSKNWRCFRERKRGQGVSQARKESQGNAIFPVQTDGRSDGRTDGRTGQTDRQAGRRTNERKESASWCREAGRLHDGGLATSHRAEEDLYPRSWRDAARHGAARRDSARSAQVRLGPRPRSPPNTWLTTYTLLAIRQTSGRFRLLFSSPLDLFALPPWPLFLPRLLARGYRHFVSRNLKALSIVTSIDSCGEASCSPVSAFLRAPYRTVTSTIRTHERTMDRDTRVAWTGSGRD